MAIDYTPYFTPVARAAIAQFRRESRQRTEPWARVSPQTVIGGLAFVLVVAYVFIVAGISGPRFWADESTVMLTIIVALGIVAVVIGIGTGSRRWERLYRRVHFATTNGLLYLHELPLRGYPGLIFSVGTNPIGEARYQRLDPFLDFGGYRYEIGSGKRQRTERWGYAAMRLPRRLPHMLLDARANNDALSGSRLPTGIHRSQVLSLEGDFNRHFTLYCPREYERDALYVFTPDLMALLIDESSAFDVEIVDDWLFLYSPRGLSIDDPAVVDRIFRIADTVLAKATRQTMRYADERIGDPSVNLVAPRGRRLRTGRRELTIGGAAGVLVVAFVAYRFVS